MWRLIYAIPSWILFEVLNVPLMLLGWILVPIAATCGAYKPEFTGTKWIWHFTWKWMFLWDNYEDGIANNTYKQFKSMFMQIVYWSCLRNPTNNLRITPILSCKIDPKKVGFKGSFSNSSILFYDTAMPQWFFAWHGLYTTFYWQFVFKGNLKRFWIGWKIYPTDIFGVTEYRKNGAGFTAQFKTIKRGVSK